MVNAIEKMDYIEDPFNKGVTIDEEKVETYEFEWDPKNTKPKDIVPKTRNLDKKTDVVIKNEAIKKLNPLDIAKPVKIDEDFLLNEKIMKKYNQVWNILWIGSTMFPDFAEKLKKEKIDYKKIDKNNWKKALQLIKEHFAIDKTPQERIKVLANIIKVWKKEKYIFDNNHWERNITKWKEVKLNTYILWVLQMLADMAWKNTNVDFTWWKNTNTDISSLAKEYSEKVLAYDNTIRTSSWSIINNNITKIDSITKAWLDLRWTNWVLTIANAPEYKVSKI